MIFSIFDSKPMLAYKAKILSSKVHIGKFHKVWPQRTLINVWMVNHIYISMVGGKREGNFKTVKNKETINTCITSKF